MHNEAHKEGIHATTYVLALCAAVIAFGILSWFGFLATPGGTMPPSDISNDEKEAVRLQLAEAQKDAPLIEEPARIEIRDAIRESSEENTITEDQKSDVRAQMER